MQFGWDKRQSVGKYAGGVVRSSSQQNKILTRIHHCCIIKKVRNISFSAQTANGGFMCKTSIYDARNNFSNLVKLAETGEPVELTRYDKPVAVIISYEEYKKINKQNKESWLSKWRREHAEYLTSEGIPLPEKVYADPNRIIFEE